MTSTREEPGRWVLLDLDHHEEQLGSPRRDPENRDCGAVQCGSPCLLSL